jgi:beta-galactosidase/beta-glucuronidase
MCEVLEDRDGGLPVILGERTSVAAFNPSDPDAVPRVLSSNVVTAHMQRRSRNVAGMMTSSRLEIAAADTQLWSAEEPNMYTMLLTLLDREDDVLEVIRLRVGLRDIEVRHGRLLINSKEVTLRGVNRHEHHPDLGQVIPPDIMSKTSSSLILDPRP